MIRLAHPEFDREDLERIAAALDSGMLLQGANVAAFEAAAGAFTGATAIACSSGTAALHLAVMALDPQPGDEVIVPAFTWPSTAHVIVQAGARPVFVDVDTERFSLIAGEVAAALSPRTRAVLPVHLFGIPAPMAALDDVLRSRPDVRVVEDAACAIGTRVGDRHAGTLGWVGCLSLHPRKTITTAEGGLLLTSDPELARRLRRLRNHGMEPADGVMTFLDAGLNYRLTELGGALGVGQMKRLPGFLDRRRALAACYAERLRDVHGVRLPEGTRDPGTTFQSLVVELAPGLDRAALIRGMRELGVETTIGTYSVVEQPYYQQRWQTDPARYPGASHAARRLMSLPLHPRMTDDDVDHVVRSLRSLLTRSAHREEPA